MSKSKQIALFAMVAVVAIAAGVALNQWYGGNFFATKAPATAAQTILALNLPDLDQKPQPLTQWRGKVLVVNFWATWCAPCREEIPMFVKMQEKYRGQGVQFVGIAIDQPDKTAAFAREFGVNYPLLIGGFDVVDLSRNAGNQQRGLPFTLIFDRGGEIKTTQIGELKQEKLEASLRPLL